MSSFKITFENAWYLLLLIPSFLIILLPYLRLPKNRRKTFKRIAPVVLHLCIVVLLIMVISGMAVVTKATDQTVIILMDCSDSMEKVSDEVIAKTQQLLSNFDKDVKVGVIAFGEKKMLVLDPEDEARTMKTFSVDGTGTDIAEALDYAASLFPDNEAARIVLLSDGKQTNSEAESMAYYLSTIGIEIDVLYFDTTTANSEMQLVEVTSDGTCFVGDTVELTVELESNTEGAVMLGLFDNDVLIEEVEASTNVGTNLYTISTEVTAAGSHSYSVILASDSDAMTENNTAYTVVTAYGSESLLLVADKLADTELLGSFLTNMGCTVNTSTTKNFPKSIVELCNYDEIILLNVNAEDLPSGAESLLESYVSFYGRTLLAVGGTDTFQYGNMSDTTLEEILPTIFELTESDESESVALMLVLDCSMSMSNNSTYLTIAKQGAVKVVESMSDNDYIGVISFNSSAILQAELTQATESNKALLTRTISALGTRQGTYYTEALKLAYQELSKSDAPVKHVIFLSDGNPSDRGYDEVISSMASDGITVSTIGLGISSSTLSNMASNGNGRYYYVASAKDLPSIMVSETEQVVVNALIEGDTPVRIMKETEVTSGIKEEILPSLSGYIGLTAKEEATVLLSTENDRPILTVWEYGKGTTAVFAGDLVGNWSSEWFNNATGQRLIYNICTGFVDVTDHESSMIADVKTEGMNAIISVKTSVVNTGDSVLATIMNENKEIDLQLLADGNGSYSATVELEECGNYSLVLLQKNEAEENVDYLITSFSVNYSSEYNAFRDDGETVLLNLVELTGGVLTDSVKTITDIEPHAVLISKDPLIVFCVLAMLMMLADIAIRKIRLKDLKRILGIRK